MARPKKIISALQVQKLAGYGCNLNEIADVCECSVDTIERRFAENLKLGRANRKMRLRKKQTELALRGSEKMLIWLGKQELDQRDRQEYSFDPNQFDVIIGKKDQGTNS